VVRLYEDRNGDVWIGTRGGGGFGVTTDSVLARWTREDGNLQIFTDAEGLPSGFAPAAFAEDRSGALWISSYYGGLARYTEGRFMSFTTADGLPAGGNFDLHLDVTGRLWIASTAGGLARIDDPLQHPPTFLTYTTADGLSSDNVRCLTEDNWGRIYAGTARGVDRIHPESGRIEHYSVDEGLASEFMTAALRDRRGRIWFGSISGLSRLDPQPPRVPVTPTVWIGAVSIRGEPYPVSELGETDVGALSLGPDQNQLQISFFAVGTGLRYQYRLEGAEGTWSQPIDQRSVNFSNLAPGKYRFLVRAVTDGSPADPTPASVTFSILPPYWLRWWFLTLVGLAVALVAYAAYRLRIARLLALERIRTRIATDLHDDIGASLSQIAILSEVVRRQVGAGGARVNERLSQIAGTSRELVDSMSDIVWAINPQRDTLRDLTQRMRRFASDIFTASDIAFGFHGPDPELGTKLRADVRREIFLVFKESVNNIVRHSECTRAEIDFGIEGRRLVLRLSDDGHGFDTAAKAEGHGLMSMRKRAESLHGEIDIISSESRGTTITLKVPLGRGWCRGALRDA